MTDREKLIELMEQAYFCSIENLADHLIANGVVVREKGENLKANILPSLFECSKCGWFDWDTYTNDTGGYNFCPNCGADMRKGENDA